MTAWTLPWSPLAPPALPVTQPGRPGLWLLALLSSSVGIAMAGAAAQARSGQGWDCLLITATAVVLAAGAHLLPALARRQPAAWALWLGCVLATLYGHAHFYASAGERAGQQRAQALAAPAQTAALESELAAIQVRPLAAVATEHGAQLSRLAQSQAALTRCEHSSPGRCTSAGALLAMAQARADALGVELAQARKASELRARLVQAAAEWDQHRQSAAQDPVDRQLAAWLGVSVHGLGFASSLVQSLLLELVAACLWVLALRPQRSGAIQSPGLPGVTSPAVSGGDIRPAGPELAWAASAAIPQAESGRPPPLRSSTGTAAGSVAVVTAAQAERTAPMGAAGARSRSNRATSGAAAAMPQQTRLFDEAGMALAPVAVQEAQGPDSAVPHTPPSSAVSTPSALHVEVEIAHEVGPLGVAEALKPINDPQTGKPGQRDAPLRQNLPVQPEGALRNFDMSLAWRRMAEPVLATGTG